MTFLRRKWQQKPKQRGPFSAVQSALFHNAENMGIDPVNIALAMPMWSPGDQLDYSKNKDILVLNPSNAPVFTPGPNGLSLLGDSSISSSSSYGLTTSLSPDFYFDTINAGSWIIYCTPKDAVGGACVFEEGGASNGVALAYKNTTKTFVFEVVSSAGDNIVIETSASLDLGESGVIAVTTTGTNSKIFLNGDEDNSGTHGIVQSHSGMPGLMGLNLSGSTLRDNQFGAYVYSVLRTYNALSTDQIAALSDNPWQLWQPVSQKTIFLPLGSGLFPINSINQSQSIDNLDLIQQHILSINPIDQPQSIDNITLSVGITLQINNIAQNQTIDILNLVQQNVLSIDPINQDQTLENILLSLGISLQIDDISQPQNIDPVILIQQNILNIDDTNQPQSLDNVLLSLGIVLSINDSSQSQEIDNIELVQQNIISVDSIDQSQTIENLILESGIILQIAKIIQNQTTGNLDLSQANIIAINDLIQSQIIDNLVFGQVVGKITITLTLSQPKIELELKQPSITLTRN